MIDSWLRGLFVLNTIMMAPRTYSHGEGGGGGHCHWKLYHIHVNRPQKSTLNEDLRIDQNTPLMPWSHLCVKPPRMSNVRQI